MLSSCWFFPCSTCHPVIALDFFLSLLPAFFPFHCLSPAESKPINIPASPQTSKPTPCQRTSREARQARLPLLPLKRWASAALAPLRRELLPMRDGPGQRRLLHPCPEEKTAPRVTGKAGGQLMGCAGRLRACLEVPGRAGRGGTPQPRRAGVPRAKPPPRSLPQRPRRARLRLVGVSHFPLGRQAGSPPSPLLTPCQAACLRRGHLPRGTRGAAAPAPWSFRAGSAPPAAITSACSSSCPEIWGFLWWLLYCRWPESRFWHHASKSVCVRVCCSTHFHVLVIFWTANVTHARGKGGGAEALMLW